MLLRTIDFYHLCYYYSRDLHESIGEQSGSRTMSHSYNRGINFLPLEYFVEDGAIKWLELQNPANFNAKRFETTGE